MKKRYGLILLGFVAVGMSGCGPTRPADLPPLYPVEITVQQAGAPLAGADVTLFNPSVANYIASATTNEQGVATITTKSNTSQWPGAPEGDYTVLISKKTVPPLDPAVDPNDTSPEGRAKLQAAQQEQSSKTAETVALEFSQFVQAKTKLQVTAQGVTQTIDVGDPIDLPLSQVNPSSSDH